MKNIDKDKFHSIAEIFKMSFDNTYEAQNIYRIFWTKRSIFLTSARELGIIDSMKHNGKKAMSYNQWQAIKAKSIEITNESLKSDKHIIRFNAQKTINKREYIFGIIDRYFENQSNIQEIKEEIIRCVSVLNREPQGKSYLIYRIVKSDRFSDISFNISKLIDKYIGGVVGIKLHKGNIKIIQKGIVLSFYKVNQRNIIMDMEQIKAFVYILENIKYFIYCKNRDSERNNNTLRNIKKFIQSPQSFDKYDVVYTKDKEYRSLWL